MKKIFTFLLVACFSVTLSAQTIVSTTPSNRNVILEEFTGKTCQFCPDGHKRAQQLMDQNPGRFFAINVHQGGYASGTPNYTTPYGNALASQAGMGASGTGYPAGTINRQAFTGVAVMGSSLFLYDRGSWASAAAKAFVEPSCLNVAAAGTLDWSTRQLTLLVEVYYTGNAVQSTNKVTVAMLQSEILGPQTGGSTYYPEMMEGGQYRHMHMLRDFITGQWGMDVAPTTTGSFWSHTFQYTIPQDFNSIDVVLEDLDFLVYVAENEKTIISGSRANVTHTNMPAIGAKVTAVSEIKVLDCSDLASAYVKINNVGSSAITSAELSYTIANGTPQTYIWNNGSIPSMSSDTIHLPKFLIQTYQNQTVKVELLKVNNQTVPVTSKTITIKKDVVEGDYSMKLYIRTDQYPTETSYKIFNPDGTILKQGTTPTANTEHEIDFIPIMGGCHRVEVSDNYGDGAGPVRILNSAGTQIYYNNGQYGAKLTAMASVDQYTVTASAGDHGTISPVGTEDYLAGTKVEYTFTPDQGYLVEDVLIDGTPINKPYITNYTLTVDKNYTIHVIFKEAAYFKITASAGENGTISPVGEKEYMESTDAKYTFTPNDNYVVEEVYIDDVPMNMPLATSYTFNFIVKDHKIHVTFKKAGSYTITASAGENGTISPEGEIEYQEGGSAEFIFTPNANYEVEEVFIDDQPMGMAQATSYTFPVVDKNYKIHVTFKYIVGIKDINGVTIAVAPNPVQDKLFVTGTYDKLEIYSIAGQILTTAYKQPAIDVNNLAKGIYFVKIQTNGQTCTFKVVK